MSEDNTNGDDLPDDDYKVGHKRPPKHSQFRKGQSGNPRGRPKKATDKTETPSDLFRRVMERSIRVKMNGTSVTMSTQEAIIEKTVADALSGDHRARREILSQLAKLPDKAEPKVYVDHTAEVRAKLLAMKERIAAARAVDEERKRLGLPPLR